MDGNAFPHRNASRYQAFPRACAFAGKSAETPAGKKDFPDFKKRLKAYSERMDLMGVTSFAGTSSAK